MWHVLCGLWQGAVPSTYKRLSNDWQLNGTVYEDLSTDGSSSVQNPGVAVVSFAGEGILPPAGCVRKAGRSAATLIDGLFHCSLRLHWPERSHDANQGTRSHSNYAMQMVQSLVRVSARYVDNDLIWNLLMLGKANIVSFRRVRASNVKRGNFSNWLKNTFKRCTFSNFVFNGCR